MEYLPFVTGVSVPTPPRSYHVQRAANNLSLHRQAGKHGYALGSHRKRLSIEYGDTYLSPDNTPTTALYNAASRVLSKRPDCGGYTVKNTLAKEMASQPELRMLAASMTARGHRLKELAWEGDGSFRFTYEYDEGDGVATRTASLEKSHARVNLSHYSFVSATNCRSSLRQLFTSRDLTQGSVLDAELPKSFEATLLAIKKR